MANTPDGFLTSSITRAVLMQEDPLPIGAKSSLEIVVGIEDFISLAAIANLEVEDLALGPVDEVVCPTGRWKSGAHAGAKQCLAFIRHEGRFAFQNIDEFVLPAVPVQEC